MQVAAWFVAGMAWTAFAVSWLALFGAPKGKMTPETLATLRFAAVVAMLSSGVAVAATAAALGVGR